MPRIRRLRRVMLAVTILLVVVLVGVGTFAVSTVRGPFPQTAGELRLEGLTGRVDVVRDGRGVPTIYADSAADLFRAQGFVTAQDRFFQMDLRRRITAGRLSEMVGTAGLDSDKVIRTMGWRRVAERELPLLAPETRQHLQAYADGVNSYIRAAKSPTDMSLEYFFLARTNPDYRVEPWTPVDSLAWLKAMAWDLRGDYNDELARARLSRSGRSTKQIGLLYPPYPIDRNQPILSPEDWQPTGSTASPGSSGGPAPTVTPSGLSKPGVGAEAFESAALAIGAVPTSLGTGDDVGSNSWVVPGSRTTTGKPLLANDPHLSLAIPAVWSQVNLQCRTVSNACPFRVSGFAFAGLPGVVIGHNEKIAWGMTNLGPDTTDFFLEQVTGDTYLRDGEQLPLDQRIETIKVAGGDDAEITVRSTLHGPILSDVLPAVDEAGDRVVVRGAPQSGSFAVALAWTALTPSPTADAIFALNRASDWGSFREAARLFAVPSQNLVYADTEGHVGYQSPGLIPVRRSSTPGAPPGYWPAPGWDSQWDWAGWVPFEALPSALDPPDGAIVAANQAVSASPSPFLTSEWDYGFRAQRIRELLGSATKVSPELMAQIQVDERHPMTGTLTERLLAINVDEFTGQGQRLLRDWDGSQPADKTRDSASAAYYNAVWKYLLEFTFDELPADIAPDGGSRWMVVVEQLLKDPKNDWWDDKTTNNVTEGSGEILYRALVQARIDLTKALGKVPGTWRWGRLHQLDLKHPVMSAESVPQWVQDIFGRGDIELGGGNSIVNANAWHASREGYHVTSGAAMRMVVDLSDLDRSRWVNSTGQSGHAYSDHYADQIDAWSVGELFPWPFSERAVRDGASDTLVLLPPESPEPGSTP